MKALTYGEFYSAYVKLNGPCARRDFDAHFRREMNSNLKFCGWTLTTEWIAGRLGNYGGSCGALPDLMKGVGNFVIMRRSEARRVLK